jgi:putative transposase
MKKNRYMEEQIACALKQAELVIAVPEICRKLGIAERTFYRWRSKYTGMLPSDLNRLKQLEEENSKLKKLVAELGLDNVMLQDVLLKNDKAC